MNKSRVWIATAALTIGIASLGGCKSMGDKEDREEGGAKHVDIPADQLPQAVRDGFAKAFPGATIKEAEKETYPDGTVHYEIEYTGADGKEHDAEFSAEGEQLDKH
jgi:hypothetical protein